MESGGVCIAQIPARPTMVILFIDNDPSSVLQTKESFVCDGKLAFTTGQSVSQTMMYGHNYDVIPV